MKNFIKLFYLGYPNFHNIALDSDEYKQLISYFESNLPTKALLTTIDMKNVFNKDDLFREFSDAFVFPEYFGNNWDAFDECMTDLSWIKSGDYILILKNVEQTSLGEAHIGIFLKSLKNIVHEWRTGMYFNKEFPTPPTPFHVVFASETANIRKLKNLLKSFDITDIGIFEEIEDTFKNNSNTVY